MAAPAIGLRPRWAPSVHAQIDWSHPLSAGMILAWWPGIRNDPIDGALWTENVATGAAGPFGAARQIASTQKITRTDVVPLQVGAIMIVQRLTAAPATNGNSVGNPTNDTTNRWGGHVPFGDGTIYFDIRNTTTGRLSHAGHTWGNWDVILLTNGPANGQSIWINGRRVATDTIADARGAQQPTFGWGQHGGVAQATTTQASIITAWNREPATTEIAMLAADPFCMLRR
jgi:hypothetical protein